MDDNIFENFGDFGITFDDRYIDETESDPLPPLRRWQPQKWWNRIDDDHPEFASLEDRAIYDVTRYALPVLARLRASPNDRVLEHNNELVSLNDLLAYFDPLRSILDK